MPDPEEDEIQAVFYCFQTVNATGTETRTRGAIAVGDDELRKILRPSGYELCLVETESDLFNRLVEKVRLWDPEIIIGYEIQRASLGYLLARAETAYGLCFSSFVHFRLNLIITKLHRSKIDVRTRQGSRARHWTICSSNKTLDRLRPNFFHWSSRHSNLEDSSI